MIETGFHFLELVLRTLTNFATALIITKRSPGKSRDVLVLRFKDNFVNLGLGLGNVHKWPWYKLRGQNCGKWCKTYELS